MSYYLKDSDLLYEIILSKGKGYLTKNAEKFLILIAENMIRKKYSSYKNTDEMLDCMQSGLLSLFQNWYKFNELKYNYSLPYFSEVFKRGIAAEYNLQRGKKRGFIKTINYTYNL